jgi:hypothetical protein
MSLYAIALFLHIVGVLLLITAFTAEGISLIHLRRVGTSPQVTDWQGVAGLARVFGPASVVAIIVPGLYMMITSWGWVPWIAAGLLVWLLIAVLGAVNGIRLSLATQHAAADAAAIHQLRAGAFVVSWWMRITLALGIVFLMTTKPELLGASLTVVIAAAIGLAAGTLGVTTASRPALSR